MQRAVFEPAIVADALLSSSFRLLPSFSFRFLPVLAVVSSSFPLFRCFRLLLASLPPSSPRFHSPSILHPSSPPSFSSFPASFLFLFLSSFSVLSAFSPISASLLPFRPLYNPLLRPSHSFVRVDAILSVSAALASKTNSIQCFHPTQNRHPNSSKTTPPSPIERSNACASLASLDPRVRVCRELHSPSTALSALLSSTKRQSPLLSGSLRSPIVSLTIALRSILAS